LRIDSSASATAEDARTSVVSGTVSLNEAKNKAAAAQDTQLIALLKTGQAKLKKNDPDGALNSFEQALSLHPNHAEALVKKGAALERLKRTDEALECYDRAILIDASMTSAYLHKGSLFNRMDRFKEALECYERALQTQDE
jgi:tetratricopeptide (TPR) repeat protein